MCNDGWWGIERDDEEKEDINLVRDARDQVEG